MLQEIPAEFLSMFTEENTESGKQETEMLQEIPAKVLSRFSEENTESGKQETEERLQEIPP